MKIVTSEQMSSIDRRAIDEFGIPSIVLMENAASAVTEVIERHYPEAEEVALFCGTGKNGGDGLAVARHLHNRGLVVHIFIVGKKKALTGDAAINLRTCEQMAIPIATITDDATLVEALARASTGDLVIDAIFGTGLNRPAAGLHADVILSLSQLRLPILSIDLPSGLNGSSAEVEEPVVEADITVTFAQPKIPHIFSPAAAWCGEVVVADISIPRAAVDAEGVSLSLIRREDVVPLIPPRAVETHKGSYGHVVLISGSEGKSGAAILAARGAVRAGAGLVTVATDPETARIVDSASVESMTLPIHLESRAIGKIAEFLHGKAAVLIGPGLPDTKESYEVIREIMARIDLPMIVDATAINAWQGRLTELNAGRHPCILTPHPGELARLLGISVAAVQKDRIGSAREAANRSGCVVVLKGHQTLIAEPEGRLAVNPTGNPGMASGGAGDVLSGILAAFVARMEDLFEAACAATYLHGAAGDRVRDEASDIGITALDLAEALPRTIEMIRKG
ncbi:MAG TPA: NAD(P)H-hydrate dehydratase [Thermoanaerobaculia bacterium]|nr:NAD(P)H-hydrate dehydratase [Thermoanaerobaculia bacterium]